MTALREALIAEPDDDFELPSVVRRRAPAKPQRKAGTGERVAALAARHPRKILAAIFLTGCGGMIAWNALVLQSSRHPAPLFSQRDVQKDAAPAPEPALARPLPPARPDSHAPEAQAQQHFITETSPVPAMGPAPVASAPMPPLRAAAVEPVRNGGEAAPPRQPSARVAQPAAPTAVAPVPVRAPTVRDPIGEIIRMGGPVPVPPANVGQSDPGDLVLSGQRALARLGYSLKVDGIMGPGTRQAIERFEQDRHLPVTGTFSARTVRELSALSGIAVQ